MRRAQKRRIFVIEATKVRTLNAKMIFPPLELVCICRPIFSMVNIVLYFRLCSISMPSTTHIPRLSYDVPPKEMPEVAGKIVRHSHKAAIENK